MPEGEDISGIVFVRPYSFDSPLLFRTHASGLESGRKVGELNYCRVDFQNVA